MRKVGVKRVNGILRKNEKGLWLTVDGKTFFPDKSFAAKNPTMKKGTIVRDIEVTVDKGTYGFFKGTVVLPGKKDTIVETFKMAANDGAPVYRYYFDGVMTFITLSDDVMNVYYDGERLISSTSRSDIDYYKGLKERGYLKDLYNIVVLLNFVQDSNKHIKESGEEECVTDWVRLSVLSNIYKIFKNQTGCSLEDIKNLTLYVWNNLYVYSEDANIVLDCNTGCRFSTVDVMSGSILRECVLQEMPLTVESLIDFCKQNSIAAGPLETGYGDVSVPVMGRVFKFKDANSTYSINSLSDEVFRSYKEFVESLPEWERSLVSDTNKLVLGYTV